MLQNPDNNGGVRLAAFDRWTECLLQCGTDDRVVFSIRTVVAIGAIVANQ